jgi:hypothetical protein
MPSTPNTLAITLLLCTFSEETRVQTMSFVIANCDCHAPTRYVLRLDYKFVKPHVYVAHILG